MKKKNKKLKKEFKKLLHAQLSEKIKKEEVATHKKESGTEEKKENKPIKTHSFIKRDLIKTSIISVILFALIFFLYLYLKNSEGSSEFAKKILEIFSI